MSSFYNYKDPNWSSRKDELLRRVNYQCAEGCDNRATSVRVCYYVEGREVWELPDSAYKCYCPKHWDMRRNVEEALRITLATLSISELDVLNEAIKNIIGMRPNNRDRIIEQVFNEAKNKQRERDSFPEQTYDGEDEVDEEDEY